MIYRYAFSFDKERPESSVVRSELPCGLRRGIQFYEYEANFELVIPADSWPHCKLLRAPILPKWRFELARRFHEQLDDMADVFSVGPHLYVNDRARAVFESVDNFGHQFHHIPFLDEHGRALDNYKYYQMNIRRYVKVDEDSCLSAVETEFWPFGAEKKFIPMILNSPEMHPGLASLPIWKHVGLEEIFYVSQDMYRAIEDSGISILDNCHQLL